MRHMARKRFVIVNPPQLMQMRISKLIAEDGGGTGMSIRQVTCRRPATITYKQDTLWRPATSTGHCG
jgi:hypothetical protein